MLEAFAWGLFAASSLVLGAVLVDIHQPTSRNLGLIMGFGAGVLIAAVAFELVEEAADTVGDQPAVVAFGMLAGALVYFLGDLWLERPGSGTGKPPDPDAVAGAGMGIVLGTILDGVPESAVLGLTLLQTGSIGVTMLVAVFVSNLPEAVGASSDLAAAGWPRARILGLWTVVALVSAAASAAGFALLDGASDTVVAVVLAFAGGAILCMLTSTMVPEAYDRAKRATGLAATLGFVVAFFINWLES